MLAVTTCFFASERRSHQPIGNFDPADELDDDIDVVSGNDLERVVQEGNARILRPHDGEPSRVLISHRRELYGCTSSRGDDVGVLQQGRHEAFPDHPATTLVQPEFHGPIYYLREAITVADTAALSSERSTNATRVCEDLTNESRGSTQRLACATEPGASTQAADWVEGFSTEVSQGLLRTGEPGFVGPLFGAAPPAPRRSAGGAEYEGRPGVGWKRRLLETRVNLFPVALAVCLRRQAPMQRRMVVVDAVVTVVECEPVEHRPHEISGVVVLGVGVAAIMLQQVHCHDAPLGVQMGQQPEDQERAPIDDEQTPPARPSGC